MKQVLIIIFTGIYLVCFSQQKPQQSFYSLDISIINLGYNILVNNEEIATCPGVAGISDMHGIILNNLSETNTVTIQFILPKDADVDMVAAEIDLVTKVLKRNDFMKETGRQQVLQISSFADDLKTGDFPLKKQFSFTLSSLKQ